MRGGFNFISAKSREIKEVDKQNLGYLRDFQRYFNPAVSLRMVGKNYLILQGFSKKSPKLPS